ncbi:peptidoglycan-binding protein [Streptomyces phaeochromogenes]|uniref:Peptidoglycan-binding protein n=1 Tax=Streptomyces phaeochromogenes TaxID=1923 RepID=A0ABZ1H5X4_STRPH|nr:peptidoglycan-binding protein [Streptomyces phaeochromogenes]MCX5602237.1 peptidoglycan-binding protein [Streptomyces phaeochromogenes]WRZ26982.1 peptidoglycan-binding protein [Streptomyces phaeochromogenes]WSD12548.1 peptidoglycan-binding protein [Streptomyces phaeochromogenes]WSJ10657.1 peptidoglycan-binding protein [Streptomyces phaeochromogenes]
MRTRRLALLCSTAVLALGGSLAVAPSASAAVAETNCNYISDTARPTVRPNDEGNAVRQVQCLINYYSKYSDWLDVDGDYGQATARGVYYVQTCNATDGGADGIVGPSTWNRLYNPKPACAL